MKKQSLVIVDNKDLLTLQAAVLAILDNASAYEWSVQGFGMLRLYIRKIGRLHIWDSILRYPNVSLVHNHSWDLRSTVVFGELVNTRYMEALRPAESGEIEGVSMKTQRLVTGYQTHMVSDVRDVSLVGISTERYFPGDIYQQKAQEIHRTDALDGTVTLMLRNDDENGQADVYWPANGTWGTAKPRRATEEEIRNVVTRTLVRHDYGV